MVCKPAKSKGLLMGIILAGFFFGIAIWGINVALGPEEKTFRLLLLVPAYALLAIYAFMWIGLATIKYTAKDEGLVIAWAHKRYTIPWSEITNIMTVTGRLNLVNYFGVSWPGYIAGTYDVRGVAACKIFGTDLNKLVVIKAGRISFGITPSSELTDIIAQRSTQEITMVDLYDVPDQVIGKIISEDLIYLGLFILNVICLVFMMLYLGIFFPGSEASTMVILLLVLDLAILAFNMVNASRLYHYMPGASYLLWFIGLFINISFLVMSMSVVGFGMK